MTDRIRLSTIALAAFLGLAACSGGEAEDASSPDEVGTSAGAATTTTDTAPEASSGASADSTERDRMEDGPEASPSPEAQVEPSGSVSQVGPSFDCAKAGTAVERTICDNPMLAAADADLANLYRQVSGQRSQQRAFIRRRNACGPDDGCLGQAYVERLSELRRIVRGNGGDWKPINPGSGAERARNRAAHADPMPAASSRVPDEYNVRTIDMEGDARRARENPNSCLSDIGRTRAEELVMMCHNVSPATRPPCSMVNACSLVTSEIRRGCKYLGRDAPAYCSDFD